MFEKGKVKFFDSRDNKRFGFLILDDGSEIFFHFNDGMNLEAGQDEPRWCLPPRGKRLWDPKPGDTLVFERKQGRKGPKASPWTHEMLYERALKAIANRPAPTVYRVLKTMNDIGEQPGEPEVLWDGSDLKDLLRRYPLPSGRQSPSADPLLPYWSDADNIFEVRHWFERKTESGWEKCPDPR